MPTIENSFVIQAPLQAVWDFHTDPNNALVVSPPPFAVKLSEGKAPLQLGSPFTVKMGIGLPLIAWDLRVVAYDSMRSFTDTQVRGPFAAWSHTHSFALVANGTQVTDTICYEMRFGVLGRIADLLIGRAVMRWMFRARGRNTQRIFARN